MKFTGLPLDPVMLELARLKRVIDEEIFRAHGIEMRFLVPLYRCQFCGRPSWYEPGEQQMPPDYCHESDHGSPPCTNSSPTCIS